METGMVVLKSPRDGDGIKALDTMYPSELLVVRKAPFSNENKTVTTFGYVYAGRVKAWRGNEVFWLSQGAYFSFPGVFGLELDLDQSGMVVLITRHGYLGQQVIGRIEQRGRLSYIDGCSDSLLVYPPRFGDPCLNHLHFPPGIRQTQHTHPSIRMGIVAAGAGKAFRVPDAGSSGWEERLEAGAVFLLPEQEMHSFRTIETNSTMDVIAFHPDSDWGPTDAAHPMRNRTYIGNER